MTRMRLNEDWRQFIELLNSHGVEYVIIGGLAIAFHAEPRFTGDLDVLIGPSPENAARTLEAIHAFGLGGLGVALQDLQQDGQIIQFGYRPRRIDIVTSITGVAFEEAWASRVAASLDGIPVHFIGREALIRNKRAVGRERDLADLDMLS
jgi:hypothetical protein